MTSDVKLRSGDFMESQSENDSLRSRIREVEDENQELRTQNLLQNRTIIELRNELTLMRIQMNEMADTSSLLRERMMILAQDAAANRQQESEPTSGPMVAPPLMAPPPVPPPLPSARIRISPRQVGAGEALTTPLGVSLSSPPRHRIKRDCRQGFYRSTRTPYHRLDSEPGPSSQAPFFSPERPNYFVGLKIIPQFQPFVCSSSQPSEYNDSASDSSGSDESPQLFIKPKPKPSEEPKKSVPYSRDFELLRNVRNLHHQRVRQSILQNYNLSLPGTNGKFFFPPLPSTSGEVRYFHGSNPGTSERTSRNASKVSDCVQYTFPAIHEGFHHCGVPSVVPNNTQPTRPRRFKKNIPYLPSNGAEEAKAQDLGADSESISSTDDPRPRAPSLADPPVDLDQDGFQADESSNCLTSTDNSLEKISIGESKAEERK